VNLSPTGHEDKAFPHADADGSPRPAGGRPATPVKAEANFLRFPLFALSTKGLKTLDGIECRGKIRRGGQLQAYALRATRNTASLYPGPLARRVHFALLAIATEGGLPVRNPVRFTWRDLCRRMGTAYGGASTLRQLKAAVRAIHGVVIRTESALFSKPDGQPLASSERGYHLYSDYAFKNEPGPAGGVTDTNSVWLADWYVANLNALFCAPVDYALWQALDQKSPIASRLYEFLLLNFHGPAPVLQIGYAYLATLLPAHAERFPSDARRQMEPALNLLTGAGLLESYRWVEGRDGGLQLRMHPGPVLRGGSRPLPLSEAGAPEALDDAVLVREVRSDRSPAWFLVRAFHEQWDGSTLRNPTPKELKIADALIREHGQTRAGEIVGRAVKTLRKRWPDARTFAAVAEYLPDVLAEFDREAGRRERERQEHAAAEREEDVNRGRKARRRELEQDWKPRWDGLTEEEREPIRRAVAGQWPHYTRMPHLFDVRCWEELARRSTWGNAPVSGDDPQGIGD
jgi:hypothetical protein